MEREIERQKERDMGRTWVWEGTRLSIIVGERDRETERKRYGKNWVWEGTRLSIIVGERDRETERKRYGKNWVWEGTRLSIIVGERDRETERERDIEAETTIKKEWSKMDSIKGECHKTLRIN